MGWLSTLGSIGGGIAGAAMGNPYAGSMIGGAIGGGIEGQQRSDEIKRQNRAQAEITKYSPWTNMQGQMQKNDSSFMGGAAGGVAQGFMTGNAIKNAGWFKPSIGAGSIGGNQGMAPVTQEMVQTAPVNNRWSSMGNRLVF